MRYIEQCLSTIDEARRMIGAGCQDLDGIYTFNQTGGRGRFGRAWQDGKNANLALSLCVEAREDIPLLTLGVGVAACLAIEEFCGFLPGLKWPNDVLLKGKKVCGILGERNMDFPNWIVLGIGFNVNNTGFDGEISHKAGSLRMVSGDVYDLEEFANVVYRYLFRYINLLRSAGEREVLSLYKSLCLTIGKKAEAFVEGREIKGIAEDISPQGGLILNCQGERTEIRSGEINWPEFYSQQT